MKNNYLLAIPLLSALSPSAFATIAVTDDLLLSAFGSTSSTTTDNPNSVYLNRDINDDTCFDCDTTLGVQLDYMFLDNFTTSVQLVKRPQDEWSEPQIEWLYVGYNYNHFDIKVGRLRLPTFLDSEYYYVAHAYTATRPPAEVYDSILGITSYDGLNVTWTGDLTDDISISIEPHMAFTGEYDVAKGKTDFTFNVKEMYGLKVELNSYDYRVFANALYADFDMDINVGGSKIPTSSETLTMYSFGGEYLWGAATLRAEAYYSEDNFNWYTQAAYSINQFTPYISYAEKNNSSESVDDDNHTVTTGLRYDFTPNISMNLEYQKIVTDSGKGQFTDIVDLNEMDANVYTLMVNFII